LNGLKGRHDNLAQGVNAAKTGTEYTTKNTNKILIKDRTHAGLFYQKQISAAISINIDSININTNIQSTVLILIRSFSLSIGNLERK